MAELIIPREWQTIKVSDSGILIKGVGYKKHEARSAQEPGLKPILRANNINGNLNFEDLVYVPEKRILPEQHIEQHDILFCMSSGSKRLVGKASQAEKSFDGSYGAFCALFRPLSAINPRFVGYFFQAPRYRKFISAISKGTNINNLKREHILDIDLCLPSPQEQDQVVNSLEELLSDLDFAVENLQKAQAQLKIYRWAVLKFAFEGKLTNKTMGRGGLPDRWKNVRLGEVCINVEYGSAAKSKKTGRMPVLRMGNIQSGKFDWEDLVYTDNETEIKKYSLKKNDVLFNRTNSPEWVGKTATYKGERPAIFAGYLIRINRIESLIDAAYLTYYLNSHIAKKYGDSVKSFGVNQSNINGTKLKTYPLPLAPLCEQRVIVQEIESRFSVSDKMEESIAENLKKAAALRQSIFKQAFEGKLTQQWRKEHKDLISGENSAEALLGKINNENEALRVKKGREKHD